MENTVKIFNGKNCCGCGACEKICPRQAITMEEDGFGFVYPRIHEKRCISCGLCEKICVFQKKSANDMPKAVYALSRKDMQRLRDSASGGVFAGIAEQWIEQGGIVFGAALLFRNGRLTPCHVAAQTQEELHPLFGSKYVQSDLGTTFSDAKKLLDNGRKVLFSGTPCQIAGLKSWLKKDYSELLTIDLVCHGVPSAAMFEDYLDIEGEKIGHSIEDFRFRDKENGWGKNARLIYCEDGKQTSVCISSSQSSFYELFLRSEICRENCYNCPYANANHPADLTVGDYWGIEKEHPEYLSPEGMLDQEAGISMLMVNTEKGIEAFEKYKEVFWYYPSTFQKASEYNEQLKHPSISGANREEILRLYQRKGYRAVDRWYWRQKQRERIKESILHHLHYDIPEPIRNVIKSVLFR